jgi:hypothetical protein
VLIGAANALALIADSAMTLTIKGCNFVRDMLFCSANEPDQQNGSV